MPGERKRTDTVSIDKKAMIGLMKDGDWCGVKLAEKARVNRSTINRAKAGGRIKRSAAARIAEALNVPLAQITTVAVEESPSKHGWALTGYLGHVREQVHNLEHDKTVALHRRYRPADYDSYPLLARKHLAVAWSTPLTIDYLSQELDDVLAGHHLGSGRSASLFRVLTQITDRTPEFACDLPNKLKGKDSLDVLIMLQRHYVNIGNYKKSEELDKRIRKMIRSSAGNGLLEWLVDMRRARVLFEDANLEEARTLFNALRQKTVDPSDLRSLVMPPEYWAIGSTLLWAMTEILGRTEPTDADAATLNCLHAAVEHGFPDSILYAVTLMAQILEREQRFDLAEKVYRDLWDTAVRLDNVLTIVKACCGLSECMLMKREEDVDMAECFALAESKTEEMPGRHYEVLTARSFYRLLTKGMKGIETAEKDLSLAAKSCSQHHPGLFKRRYRACRLLIWAARTGGWQHLFGQPPGTSILARLTRYFGEKHLGGDVCPWKYRNAQVILSRYPAINK